MERLASLLATLPEAAKDLRLNFNSVLGAEILSPAQAWSVALTAAAFVRCNPLRQAISEDGLAGGKLTQADVDDACAAAAIMGMNTIFYRTRHMIGKETYEQRRASLRMNRMLSPATSKAQFELCSLACAALAGCEVCLKSHEASVLHAGLTEDHVFDAVRLAAVVQGVAIGLELA